MKVGGRAQRSIWVGADGWSVEIIDQTRLPHAFATLRLTDEAQVERAIRTMQVRGAPLIGAAAAYGIALAMRADPSPANLERVARRLAATRPTAVNLKWAIEDMGRTLAPLAPASRAAAAYARAAWICDDDVATNRAIGGHALELIRASAKAKAGGKVNVLTHCNAGWLATVDWGTALAPIYLAHDSGMDIHVWVDETRPRNQGAGLTAWELGNHGVPFSVITDNAGGHLMRKGEVDLCLVGADRVTARGDVCNKIGTYLKALAAFDNRVPFYVAVPYSTIDWSIEDGLREIPIEERDPEEVTWVSGRTREGALTAVEIVPAGSRAANYAFDVTPARLVTGLVTERGIAPATREGLAGLYAERKSALAG